ncbi:fibronectin type III domain-containing protein, partial [Frankia sp. EI5c]|uniref:fibronectin type III domain-containing protein n=1 Tax=Frankia sp. EI5c TaxID=683316 RepID=UPI0037C12850
MVVSWITRGPVRRPRVRLRPRECDQRLSAAKQQIEAVTRSYVDAVTAREIHTHHALLTGLEPDTEYHYEISHQAPRPGRFARRGCDQPLVVGGSSFRT